MVATSCAGVDWRRWETYGTELWTRIATQLLLQGHMLFKESADMVDIAKATACFPEVYQARANTDVKAGGLELYPFVAGPLIPFKDGESISTRPERLHPSLPFACVLVACSDAADDSCRFLVKSPLVTNNRMSSETVPSPFWCVIAAKKGDPVINMERRDVTIAIPSVDYTVAGQPAKKAKVGKMALVVTAFVNSKPINKGECLVVEEAWAWRVQRLASGSRPDRVRQGHV